MKSPSYFANLAPRVALLLAAVFISPPVATSLTLALTDTPAKSSGGKPLEILQGRELAAYQAHLSTLLALVQSCSADINAAHCDPKLVGTDDHLELSGGVQRQVRYEWLRDALTQATILETAAIEAASKGEAKKNKATPAAKTDGKVAAQVDEEKPSVKELLAAAREHLILDQQAVGASPSVPPDRRSRRRQLAAILTESEFDQVEHPSAWSRAVESFLNWLNGLFARIPSTGASGWIRLAIEWGIVIGASTGLIWWLIQGSKRDRWRLEAAGGGSAVAPSLRDWQVWLSEAETFAAREDWRAAVHNVYWAAISRLESSGVWPVDRARTPSEYLTLITSADPRRPDLTTLTRSFERIWYGYRHAAQAEYDAARQLLERLVRP
ncbi:MAG TPA: DUF4129 domain-containing protein [Acidisarcina sp.]